MKKLICEMCGESDFTKSDGVFVCNNCNTKYEVEEAQKMLGAYSEAIKAEENRKIENLIKAGIEELDAKKYAEAYDIFKSILLLDADNAVATFYKGLAGAWNNVNDTKSHFSEAASAAEKAFEKKSKQDSESEEYFAFVSDALGRLHELAMSEVIGYFSLTTKEMREFAYAYDKIEDERKGASVDHLYNTVSICRQEMIKIEQLIKNNVNAYSQTACLIISLNCTLMANVVNSVQDVTKFPLDLIKKINNYLADYKKRTEIELNSFDGRLQWTYSQVTSLYSSLKSDHRTKMSSARQFVNATQKACKNLESKRKEIVVELYWKEHPEERKELEERKADFSSRISDENKKISTTAAEHEKSRKLIDGEIEALKAERSSIGFFKFKEKKAIKEKIQAKEAEKQANIAKENKAVDEIKERINTFEKRISEIDNELTKDR